MAPGPVRILELGDDQRSPREIDRLLGGQRLNSAATAWKRAVIKKCPPQAAQPTTRN
jgi:hypothetical protein